MAIALLVRQCMDAFERAKAQLGEAELDNELGRFRIWAGNVSAHSTGRRSLQYRLRDSSYLVTTVIDYLGDLLRTLDGQQEDGALGSDDEELFDDQDIDFDFSLGSTNPMAEEVSSIITCLMRVSLALHNPAKDDQIRYAHQSSARHFEPHDIEHVRSKFPKASTDVLEILGKAISRHRQYFKYREEHHLKLKEEIDEQVGEQASTVATPPAGKVEPKFDLSSMDSETMYTATSYAATLFGETSLRPPPLPDAGINGLPFECPLCYHIVIASDERSWRQHVYEDLPPYICITPNCNEVGRHFARRRDWIRHMKQHYTSWSCPLECSEVLRSPQKFKAHIRTVHQKEIDEATAEALLSSCAVQSHAVGPHQCSLCFQEKSDPRTLQKHLGHHMEQLALFAIPKHVYDDDLDRDPDASDIDDTDGSDNEIEEPEKLSIDSTSPEESEASKPPAHFYVDEADSAPTSSQGRDEEATDDVDMSPHGLGHFATHNDPRDHPVSGLHTSNEEENSTAEIEVLKEMIKQRDNDDAKRKEDLYAEIESLKELIRKHEEDFEAQKTAWAAEKAAEAAAKAAEQMKAEDEEVKAQEISKARKKAEKAAEKAEEAAKQSKDEADKKRAEAEAAHEELTQTIKAIKARQDAGDEKAEVEAQWRASYNRKQRDARERAIQDEAHLRANLEREEEVLYAKPREQERRGQEELEFQDFLRKQKEREESKQHAGEHFQDDMHVPLQLLGSLDETFDTMADEEEAKDFNSITGKRHVGRVRQTPTQESTKALHSAREGLEKASSEVEDVLGDEDYSDPEYLQTPRQHQATFAAQQSNMAGEMLSLSSRDPTGSNRRHKCPHCFLEFDSRHEFKSHLLEHTGEMPYVCHVCQARFPRSDDLKRHDQLHTDAERSSIVEVETTAVVTKNQPLGDRDDDRDDDQLYHCTWPGCAHRARWMSEIRKHYKQSHVPDEARPHGHPHCERRFTQPKDVRRHIRQIHRDLGATGEPSTESPAADAQLEQNKQHAYGCSYCEEQFDSLEDRQKHVDRMHEDAARLRSLTPTLPLVSEVNVPPPTEHPVSESQHKDSAFQIDGQQGRTESRPTFQQRTGLGDMPRGRASLGAEPGVRGSVNDFQTKPEHDPNRKKRYKKLYTICPRTGNAVLVKDETT